MPKLTKTIIDRLERSPPAKGYALHWEELRGFAARVTTQGRISYVVQGWSTARSCCETRPPSSFPF